MLAVISAMLGQLDEPTLVELTEALRLKLKPTPTATERRVQELLPLAQLIKQLDRAKRGVHGTPLVERQLYDEQRPDDAPTSQSLVERYGSWIRACRAAEGTLADGRILRADGSTRPRTPGRRNETPVYTDAEIATAIRRCAIELGRRPSARAYERWRSATIRNADTLGADRPRLPALGTISRRYRRWPQVLSAAAISERAVEQARLAELHPSGVPADPAAADRFSDADMRTLSLARALEIAVEREASLEWLCRGGSDRGTAPQPDARFDIAGLKRQIAQRRLQQRTILAGLGLQLGPYRRILNGREPPRLCDLVRMADMLGARIDGLLTC